MIRLRRASERGHARHGWLESWHTFSFADYYDPAHMGFRGLRVINDDTVLPGQGFGTHPHRDMEIISYVLEGALRHKDSLGHGSVIRPGDVQRMSAGTGVTHSEVNDSKTESVHFLQIWILPSQAGITPGYEQKSFSMADKSGRLRLVASPDGADGSVTVHADARLYATHLAPDERVTWTCPTTRHAWLHVARGVAELQGETLRAGDGAAISQETQLSLHGVETAEVLLFDLA